MNSFLAKTGRWLADAGQSAAGLVWKKKPLLLRTAVQRLFGWDVRLNTLVITSRIFPITSRVDVQMALNEMYAEGATVGGKPVRLSSLVGVQYYNSFVENIAEDDEEVVCPLQYDEIELGEELPSRCLRTGLWLAHAGSIPFAMQLTPAGSRGGDAPGQVLEFAVATGPEPEALCREWLRVLEDKLKRGTAYRGKILSFEVEPSNLGRSNGITVHKLRTVDRSQIILPEQTLRLLERNVEDFIEHRPRLKALKLSTKKGILFYGPPGTGKTHTIHYLASRMKGHTTFLISGEQVGMLDQYVQAARYLQPATIVIEDADLIAKRRTQMSTIEESMLNRLLNEMDGLREDADLLFILTTNRPEELEEALSARPGRIDQAIEFPLPDAEGRRKLITLYAGELKMDDDVRESLVSKSANASAAFIKELMRRSAQYALQAGTEKLEHAQVDEALEEMLFTGGTLNQKLLGAVGAGVRKVGF